MQEYNFLMVRNHYISLDVITLFNFRGVFILVESSDGLAVSQEIEQNPDKATEVGNEPFCLFPSCLPKNKITSDGVHSTAKGSPPVDCGLLCV